MGDFRVTGATRVYVILFCMLVKAVISTGLGKCPVYPQLPNFDIQRMTGTWYEVERSFYLMEMSASCTELQVSLNERGYLLITVNTINRWTGSPSTTYGIGITSHNGSSSFRYKLNNRMPYLIGRMLPGAGQYNVLFTDYDTFAIIWSCSSVSIAHSGAVKPITTPENGIYTISFSHEKKRVRMKSCLDRMWILGRSREIEARVRAQIYAILEELYLDPDRLIISKNNNCTEARVQNVIN